MARRAPSAEKNELKPWLKECWCIPPKAMPVRLCRVRVPEFVCAMEDVLEVYHRQFEDNEVLDSLVRGAGGTGVWGDAGGSQAHQACPAGKRTCWTASGYSNCTPR